uniref:Uncharacterized protein n=1 Tax=Glossina morsitans morsitans TaxID=37546 RepID=A0A1B0GG18_GLOMM
MKGLTNVLFVLNWFVPLRSANNPTILVDFVKTQQLKHLGPDLLLSIKSFIILKQISSVALNVSIFSSRPYSCEKFRPTINGFSINPI